MIRYFIVVTITLVVLACNRTEQSNSENIIPSKSIIGTWKVTDYQNDLLVEQSDAEIKGFESSVRLQREKMIQLSQFTFNEKGSYHLQHSPTDFDKGQWLIIADSLMVQNSERYGTSDTSIIHFDSDTTATIIMSDFTQRVTVDIEMIK